MIDCILAWKKITTTDSQDRVLVKRTVVRNQRKKRFISGQNNTKAPDKAVCLFFQLKNTDLFLISSRKHMLWYSLEAPRRGASNEYPQHMFLWRNKKKISWYIPLIWSYEHLIYSRHSDRKKNNNKIK